MQFRELAVCTRCETNRRVVAHLNVELRKAGLGGCKAVQVGRRLCAGAARTAAAARLARALRRQLPVSRLDSFLLHCDGPRGLFVASEVGAGAGEERAVSIWLVDAFIGVWLWCELRARLWRSADL